LSSLLLGAKEYAASENHAREALKLNPESANGYKLLAAALVHQKRTAEADAIAARAESAILDDLAPDLWVGRAMLAEGIELEKAESYMKKYLAQPPEPVEPTLAMAHFWIGQLYEKLGRKTDARSEMEAALRIQPDLDSAKRELKHLN
jgi:tetratricopeptide (TPR) repeat protein